MSDANDAGKLGFLEAAEKVLNEFAPQKSMHYQEISDKAIEQGWVVTDGKTPENTMNALLGIAINNAKNSASQCKFVRTGRGEYSLTEWEETGINKAIKDHNKAVRKQLMKAISELSPEQFEHLIGDQLLPSMGFDSTTTQYAKDGGVDSRGRLRLDGIVPIHVAVQVKQYASNVAVEPIRSLRGVLEAHEHGLLITNSGFTADAKAEANSSVLKPITLIDGDSLLDLLCKHKIGAKPIDRVAFELTDLPEL